MTYHKSDDSDSTDSSGCRSRRRRRARPFGARRSPGGRKERVLHTRVSEQLSDDIRRFAEDLRVPASNLVRNVLEEVFTMVDGVSEDVGDLFDDILDEAEGVRDRVRNQSRSRARREGRRSASDADVEDELRSDGAAEEADRPKRMPTKGAESADELAQTPRESEPAAELFPEVLGWQPLVLNRNFECGRCRSRLGAGESAFLGLAAGGLTEIALCGRCAGRH
jgi:uncharacterized protein YjbJ (UPF0337 family)